MKQAITWLLAILTWACYPALAEEGVPTARDFRKDGQLARDKQGVVLVMFSSAHCTYCQRVLNEFLIPMSRNADYQSKLVMRKVDNAGYANLRDFAGAPSEHRKFAGEQGVRMVPTVMIFDANGKLLAKPLVGITTVDYYGMYLDEIIDQGLGQVRAKTAAPAPQAHAASAP